MIDKHTLGYQLPLSGLRPGKGSVAEKRRAKQNKKELSFEDSFRSSREAPGRLRSLWLPEGRVSRVRGTSTPAIGRLQNQSTEKYPPAARSGRWPSGRRALRGDNAENSGGIDEPPRRVRERKLKKKIIEEEAPPGLASITSVSTRDFRGQAPEFAVAGGVASEAFCDDSGGLFSFPVATAEGLVDSAASAEGPPQAGGFLNMEPDPKPVFAECFQDIGVGSGTVMSEAGGLKPELSGSEPGLQAFTTPPDRGSGEPAFWHGAVQEGWPAKPSEMKEIGLISADVAAYQAETAENAGSLPMPSLSGKASGDQGGVAAGAFPEPARFQSGAPSQLAGGGSDPAGGLSGAQAALQKGPSGEGAFFGKNTVKNTPPPSRPTETQSHSEAAAFWHKADSGRGLEEDGSAGEGVREAALQKLLPGGESDPFSRSSDKRPGSGIVADSSADRITLDRSALEASRQERRELSDQIRSRVILLNRQGGGVARIDLPNAGQGQATITVQVEGEDVRLSSPGGEDGVRQYLGQDLAPLREALAARKLILSEITSEPREQSQQGASDQQDQQPHRGGGFEPEDRSQASTAEIEKKRASGSWQLPAASLVPPAEKAAEGSGASHIELRI